MVDIHAHAAQFSASYLVRLARQQTQLWGEGDRPISVNFTRGEEGQVSQRGDFTGEIAAVAVVNAHSRSLGRFSGATRSGELASGIRKR